MLRISNLSVCYKTLQIQKVLSDINLEVEEGEFISILGTNGAGKSTLVKVIVGEVLPSQGKVFIANKDITNLSITARSKYISRVFQDHMEGVCLELTVLENLLFASYRSYSRGLRLAKFKINEKELLVEKLRDLNIGLQDKLNDKVRYLSGGQRQALSLLMATLSPSKLLLLDEYTSALDPKSAQVVMELTLKLIKDYRLTTMMITHNLREANLANKIFRIDDGRLFNEQL